MEWNRDTYTISTDPARLDRAMIHGWLATESYWSQGIPRDVEDRAIDGSMSFGVYHGDEQVGFARVVTDGATFAWIADVFVVEEHRGRKLSLWLMECILSVPMMQSLKRVMLATRDAHDIYARFGFEPLAMPDRFMSIERPADRLYGERPPA